MKIKILIIAMLFAFVIESKAKNDSLTLSSPYVLETKTGKIRGTLTIPDNKKTVPVVLIISGSGPTDRDGNNPVMKNNCLKMLAEKLCLANIASLRYDKRGIAESKDLSLAEKDLRFDNYVEDAIAWIELLKKNKRFSKVIVIGHSEGSLIGMVAAKKAGAAAFISLAGAGFSADKILKEQLKNQPLQIRMQCYALIDSLAKGVSVNEINPDLMNLFRPSVQPYMISWFKYDPQTEIKGLNIPVLIIQGTTDIQVSLENAKSLMDANKNAKYIEIAGMNHILKTAETDKMKNIETYSMPELPLIEELPRAVIDFIQIIK